jgi:hypothetical protein
LKNGHFNVPAAPDICRVFVKNWSHKRILGLTKKNKASRIWEFKKGQKTTRFWKSGGCESSAAFFRHWSFVIGHWGFVSMTSD